MNFHHLPARFAITALLLTLGVSVWLIGSSCSVERGPGGTATITLSGTSVGLNLGPTGVFNLTPGTIIQKIIDAVGYIGGTPEDAPASASMRLRASSITYQSSDSGKSSIALQSAMGTANLKVVIDASGAADPCATGTEVGTYEIQVAANGVITVVDEELALTVSAMNLILGDDISLCLEMTSDLTGTMQISGLDVVFGPSQDGADDGDVSASFTLINFESTGINIAAPGDEADAENYVYPGIWKDETIDNLAINDLVTFRAIDCPGSGAPASCTDGDVLDTATCPRIDQGNYHAFVVWYNSELSCGLIDLSDDRACCLPDGNCLELTPEACGDLHGKSGPEGQTCANAVCQGACCVSGPCVTDALAGITTCGTCQVTTLEGCQALLGTFQGLDVPCDPWPCWSGQVAPEDYFACCFPRSPGYPPACADDLPADFCDEGGGVPQSAGVRCADNPCPEACCFPDGTCEDLTTDVCLSGGDVVGESAGTPQGVGTDCATTTCPDITTVQGGCCFDDTVGCFVHTYDECSRFGGEFMPDCEPAPRSPCDFACCLSDGTCTMNLSVNDCQDQNGLVFPRGELCDAVDCPVRDFVVWYTGNVCCWGAPLLYISDRDSFEGTALRSSFPGGGIDPTELVVKVLLQAGFDTREDAQAWICPQFTSSSFHYWCGRHYQMGGVNWQPGGLGCDLGGLPDNPNPPLHPDADVCTNGFEFP
ncbi:MAG: hypothetical protein J5J06_01015 [Phycisphaerae bacterium]|nr:hypothetical protein [Phycisphaerae bacterium]